MSTRVRPRGKGKLLAIDGPFAETRETRRWLCCFLSSSQSREAIESTLNFMELHRKYWPGWEGGNRSPPDLHPAGLHSRIRQPQREAELLSTILEHRIGTAHSEWPPQEFGDTRSHAKT